MTRVIEKKDRISIQSDPPVKIMRLDFPGIGLQFFSSYAYPMICSCL